MKTKFPGHYQLSAQQIKELWDTASIVLDTNVLLDFYRVSKQTSKELLAILGNFAEQGRIFIPYQSAYEYHANILSVISGQKKMYDEALKHLDKFNEEVAKKRSHPFMDDNIANEFSDLYQKIKDNFNEKKNNLDHLLTENEIKDKLGEMLNGKVGERFSDEDLAKIYKEGECRYIQKIPPGFKDSNKNGNEKYGDLVVWKEIIQYSKNNSKSIIFVSSDNKEDWYQKIEGKTISPLPQLREEFLNETGQIIHFYSLEQFLNHAKNEGKANISDQTINEVGNLLDLWERLKILNSIHAKQAISSSPIIEEDENEKLFGQISTLARDWTCSSQTQDSGQDSTKKQATVIIPQKKKKYTIKRRKP